MLAIAGVICLVSTALWLAAVYPLRGRLATLLAIVSLLYAQIVLVSTVLSLASAISATGFVAAHVLMALGAAALWWRRGRPNLFRHWLFSLDDIKHGIVAHPLLSLFAAAVLGLVVAGMVVSITYPAFNDDTYTYHLPRAYFWLQAGTAQHFPTLDLRQTEFPPNASFVFMWIMALTGGYRLLAVAQWMALLAAGAGTAGLARVAGHSRAASLLAGLVMMTATAAVMQLLLGGNDLITAVPGVIFLYFAFHAIDAEREDRRRELVYAGMAFGLFVGTKYIALFLLPGAALCLLMYAFARLGKHAVKPILALGVASVVGFILFGGYNYALNTVESGNPITSGSLDDASDTTDDPGAANPALYSPAGNLARYLYQIMDWHILPDAANHPLYQANLAAYNAADGALGLAVEVPGYFDYQQIGLRLLNLQGRIGLGPAAYAFILLSPVFAVAFALRVCRSQAALLSLLYLLIAASWMLVFAWVVPWDPFKPRFFLVYLPALLAATVPWLYGRQPVRLIWLLPLYVTALAGASWVVQSLVQAPETSRINPVKAELLRQILAPGSTIGLVGADYPTFELIEGLPEYRYAPLDTNSIASSLTENRVQAVIASGLDCAALGLPYLGGFDINRNADCLLLPSLDPYLEASASLLTERRMATEHDAAMDVPPDLLNLSESSLSLPVLTPLPGGLRVEMTYARGDVGTLENATCGGQPITVDLMPDGLTFEVPISALDAVLCDMELIDANNLQFQTVRLFPAETATLPASVDYRFGDAFALSHVEISGDVRPCDTLYVASGWQALSSMEMDATFVLADADGVGRAREDGRLGNLARLDAPAPFVDRRFIPIPCDLEPGSYSLLVGVYDPETVVNLPIYQADGAEIGTLLYLTTVTVNS